MSSSSVTESTAATGPASDRAPGEAQSTNSVAKQVRSYLIGFVLAAGLTVLSFYLTRTSLVWAPSIPIALSVLAIAQMGVHLVFFLHITSGPDNLNNSMALAFGLLIVMLLVFGSLWIMAHLNHHHLPIPQAEQLASLQDLHTLETLFVRKTCDGG